MQKEKEIDVIVERLQKYPHIQFSRPQGNVLTIWKQDNKGFDISIESTENDFLINLGNFHTHYEKADNSMHEVLDLILFALTGAARIKEFSKKGKPYKWKLETQSPEGVWYEVETMGLLFFNFWSKPTIQYLQNKTLPITLLYPSEE